MHRLLVYGTPEDFAYMIDYLHKNDIGVILDWYRRISRKMHMDWLSLTDRLCLNMQTQERESILTGEQRFSIMKTRSTELLDWKCIILDRAFPCRWITCRCGSIYAVLGLWKRIRTVGTNKFGGNENLEAIQFFKHLNSVVLGRNHGSVMIAEESTAWPKVTGDPEEDSLGFSLNGIWAGCMILQNI